MPYFRSSLLNFLGDFPTLTGVFVRFSVIIGDNLEPNALSGLAALGAALGAALTVQYMLSKPFALLYTELDFSKSYFDLGGSLTFP